MKRLLKQSVIAFSLSILVACSGTPETEDGGAYEEQPRGNDCIHEPSIRGYSVLDEQNLIVEAAGRRDYHVVLMRRAFGIRSSWGIAFPSPTNRICAGFGEIAFDGHFDGETIRIRDIRLLTPEEKETLLIRFGKKEPEIQTTPAPQEVQGADVEELDTNDDE